MIEITIREPIWGAGTDKMYGWAKDKLGKLGVGVRRDLLKKCSTMKINLKKGSIEYVIVDTQEAMNYALKYDSFKTVKGVDLAIFPIFPFELKRKDAQTIEPPSQSPFENNHDKNITSYPELSYRDRTVIKQYFDSLTTKEEIISVRKQTSNDHDEAFIKGDFEKVDKLAKKIKYWDTLISRSKLCQQTSPQMNTTTKKTSSTEILPTQSVQSKMF